MDALVASKSFELVAAADIAETARQRLAEHYPGIRLCENHRQMFAECPTDIVCVSTWPPTHRQIVMDALALDPRGILCEKPLGDTAAAGRDILEAIKDRRLPVVVPHGLLKRKQSEEVLACVHGGEIGDLELVEIECNKWDIINAGIHWLNYFVNLLPDDPMAWVMAATEASTQTYRDGMQVETTGITYVQSASGVRAVMHTGDEVITRRPDQGTFFRLVGTCGLIEFWAWQSAYRIINDIYPRGQMVQVAKYPESAHQRYLEDLADQIERGQSDYVLPDTSLVALELCEGAYLSAEHRCKVTLPLSAFVIPRSPAWHPGKPYGGVGGRDGRKL
jgi:predicted dehydrogenase